MENLIFKSFIIHVQTRGKQFDVDLDRRVQHELSRFSCGKKHEWINLPDGNYELKIGDDEGLYNVTKLRVQELLKPVFSDDNYISFTVEVN